MTEKKAIVPQSQSELIPIGEKVWDAERHAHIEITPELAEEARVIQNQIMLGELMRTDGFYRARSRHIHVRWGYPTYADWAKGEHGISKTHAYRLAQIGEQRLLLGEALKTAGLPQQKLLGSVDQLPQTEQLLMFRWPRELQVKMLADMWTDPEGNLLSDEEVAKRLGKDKEEMLKGLRSKLHEIEEANKTIKAENEALLKRTAPDTTIAKELTTRVEQLQEEIESLRGRRERGEAAAAMIAKASKLWEEGFAYVRPYMPDKLSDLDEMPEEIELAIGLVSRIRTRLDNLFQQWILLDMQRSQPGG